MRHEFRAHPDRRRQRQHQERTADELRVAWYQVVCARDGEEALRMVDESSPDLIILDVMMPRRNGYQVCRSIKMDPKHRDIP